MLKVALLKNPNPSHLTSINLREFVPRFVEKGRPMIITSHPCLQLNVTGITPEEFDVTVKQEGESGCIPCEHILKGDEVEIRDDRYCIGLVVSNVGGGSVKFQEVRAFLSSLNL